MVFTIHAVIDGKLCIYQAFEQESLLILADLFEGGEVYFSVYKDGKVERQPYPATYKYWSEF